MIDLATVTAETFRALVGDSLDVTLPTGLAVKGKLVRVKEDAPWSPDHRAPFGLTVTAAPDPAVPADPAQGILRIAHPALGEIDLFAVPSKKTADGVEWYIVIS